MLALWKKGYDKPRLPIKKQRHYFANKDPYSQCYGFSIVTYGCEIWTIKKAEHPRTDAFKSWCLGGKETTPVSSERNQSWIFTVRTDADTEAPILWQPDEKTWLIGNDPDVRKDWRQEEKRVTEDEMVGWHQRFNRHEFEQTPGDNDGQGSLSCCSPWGLKEWDIT